MKLGDNMKRFNERKFNAIFNRPKSSNPDEPGFCSVLQKDKKTGQNYKNTYRPRRSDSIFFNISNMSFWYKKNSLNAN
jgi:hypothetical protein